eukprot:scaffold119_cov66-Skeletonema_marinoi.AAC.7
MLAVLSRCEPAEEDEDYPPSFIKRASVGRPKRRQPARRNHLHQIMETLEEEELQLGSPFHNTTRVAGLRRPMSTEIGG